MVEQFVKTKKNNLLGMLWGFLIGEVVGLPVKDQPREFRKIYPIETITGWGTFNVPPGYWGDKTSILLSTLSGLTQDQYSILDELKDWYYSGNYTPEKKIYHISASMQQVIENYASNLEHDFSLLNEEMENGSDKIAFALLPFTKFIHEQKILFPHEDIVTFLHQFHKTPVFTFFTYLSAVLAFDMIFTNNKKKSFSRIVSVFYEMGKKREWKKIVKQFTWLVESNDFQDFESFEPSEKYQDIFYASMGAIFKTNSFKDAVLTAVNMGGPTDTLGALTGMWAGAYYGFSSIPDDWLKYIEKRSDIDAIFNNYIFSLEKKRIFIS